VYVRNKEKACAEVGFYSEKYTLPADTTQAQLNALVDELNAKKEINGILCQLPLPPHLSDKEVIARIDPAKDVDAFHPENVGAIMIGDYRFLPCTPAGVMELIRSTGTDLTGKRAVVLGRSNIVGKPVASLMMQKAVPGDATVTVCHSRTRDIKSFTLNADIIIAALGQPGFLTADMVKDGVTVIDVGTTRVPSTETKSGFRLKGDVDFENVAPKCSFITPVPGGVGPMTIVSLMKNTLLAARHEIYK
jgi:methylenetetrahydrofolate dehydrogenase (NADP+)/methenyltetrahydrofolate cyclohydrolase